MDGEGRPIPLRCVLMTFSMAVSLVLLCAGPACTHKNRGSKIQEASITVPPSSGIPVLTPPQESNFPSELPDKKVSQTQSSSSSPRNTWLMFLKHADHAAKRRKGPEETHRHRHSGPVGPPAPARHHSPPVNHALREKKMYQFLQLLTDALLKRDGENIPIYKRSPPPLPTKVHIAFTCRVSHDIRVEPGDPQELRPYEMPHEEGSFYRGSGLNLTSGRYTAHNTGLYAFFARLHIDFQKNEKSLQGFLRMKLCILSLCQDNLSLQHTLSFSANEVTATVTLNGILYVQAGQYVSLFLENTMEDLIVVLKGSDFSGVLLGQ
ncbi:erythroferrone [Hyperolius riggenbachi]|uniref:erythroferrone n=1 Tax=Hyperolius riggenbachi TaxID=752182 RepID=UPI0035A2BF7B